MRPRIHVLTSRTVKGHATSRRPGPIHFVEEQAPGHGEIQGVSRADHRDADEVRAETAQDGGEPRRSSPTTRIVGRG
jgi:hypothetical protein